MRLVDIFPDGWESDFSDFVTNTLSSSDGLGDVVSIGLSPVQMLLESTDGIGDTATVTILQNFGFPEVVLQAVDSFADQMDFVVNPTEIQAIGNGSGDGFAVYLGPGAVDPLFSVYGPAVTAGRKFVCQSHIELHGSVGQDAYIEFPQQTDPAAPVSGARLYTIFATGKNRLVALFPSGAHQVIASEP